MKQPKIDIPELQRLTDEARAQTEHDAAEQEAAPIIERIPAKLREAASNGNNQATVLRGSTEDGMLGRWAFGGSAFGSPDSFRRLCGAARLVYDYCQAQGLHTVVDPWSSATSQDVGFEIIVSWR